MRIVARDYPRRTLARARPARRADRRRFDPSTGPTKLDPADDWVAPAFWDIQINGRWGHSFSSPELTVEQVAAIVRAQGPLGTARLCPTLITAPVDHLLHGVRTIAAACERFPDVAARVLGIHLEGPFISERDGYRGAHPADGDPRSRLELVRGIPGGRGRPDRACDAGPGAHRRDRIHPPRDGRRRGDRPRTHGRRRRDHSSRDRGRRRP